MPSKRKRREFATHLGSYVIVISMLGIINLLTGTDSLWFLWPAIGWGIWLAFHFAGLFKGAIPEGKWRELFWPIVSYLIVIGGLSLMNLMTSDYPWVMWPAVAWGVGLAIRIMKLATGTASSDEEEAGGQIEAEDEKKSKKGRKRAKRERGQAAAETRVAPVVTPVPQFTNPTVQAHLDRARTYQAQINEMLKAAQDSTSRARLQELAGQMDEWVQAIEALARRVDNFQRNPIIRQDLETVPQAIADLEARLAGETDPAIRAQLERTLTNRQNQLAALQQLQKTMQRAEIQIESTLSALGTIYSQVLTGQSTDHVADYSRLSNEVDEETRVLQDHLEALSEVKLSR